jgi:3-oxoacyl-[acyl-carrier-protein] synthase II
LPGRLGAIEAITCIFSVGRNVLPPTINYEHADPECDLDYIPNESREAEVDVALSNNFGFGGHNACLVIRKFEG